MSTYPKVFRWGRIYSDKNQVPRPIKTNRLTAVRLYRFSLSLFPKRQWRIIIYDIDVRGMLQVTIASFVIDDFSQKSQPKDIRMCFSLAEYSLYTGRSKKGVCLFININSTITKMLTHNSHGVWNHLVKLPSFQVNIFRILSVGIILIWPS